MLLVCELVFHEIDLLVAGAGSRWTASEARVRRLEQGGRAWVQEHLAAHAVRNVAEPQASASGRGGATGQLERTRKLLARAAGARLESIVRCADDPEVAALCRAIGAGDVGLREAAERLARTPIGHDGRADADPEGS